MGKQGQIATAAQEASESAHAFADMSNRFALDQLLRDNGFVIAQRRKGEPVLWLKNRTWYSQEAAEAIVPKEALRLARMRQGSYQRGVKA